jgi:hypothetical protein
MAKSMCLWTNEYWGFRPPKRYSELVSPVSILVSGAAGSSPHRGGGRHERSLKLVCAATSESPPAFDVTLKPGLLTACHREGRDLAAILTHHLLADGRGVTDGAEGLPINADEATH